MCQLGLAASSSTAALDVDVDVALPAQATLSWRAPQGRLWLPF